MFGIYVHIPYCLQRCTYCDFATYSKSQALELHLPPPEKYIDLLIEEIRQKAPYFQKQRPLSIYFGGGTPSLVPAELIVAVLDALEKEGIQRSSDAEVTIEINPATIDPKKMEVYLKKGLNRFSVGAQTFDDRLLRSVHREHNSQQTRDTLNLLKSFDVNYSFDILFSLPGQTLDGLRRDLDQVLEFSPPHVSPYCLTVPEGHVLSQVRPSEDIQLAMFDEISRTLTCHGYSQYEISNFAKPGFESRHNSLYWSDNDYWGIGLSAHSYESHGWGTRYWNPSAMGAYQALVERNRGHQWPTPFAFLDEGQKETLQMHQSLTDFCHISLRTKVGLSEKRLESKFGSQISSMVQNNLRELQDRGWVQKTSSSWVLSSEGQVLSNQVFSALTFLPGELPSQP